MQVCSNILSVFNSDFWFSNCWAAFPVASFYNSSAIS